MDADAKIPISYPSYISLDRFIDVDRLKSLDGYITDLTVQVNRQDVDHV